jgi:DNA-binding FadR family transcriptional regulator
MTDRVSAVDPRQEEPAVRNLILGLIRDRGLRPGDKLPTEAEIAKVFTLSRQKVREGLHRLETLGVVRSRQGSGRILLDRTHHTLPALLAPLLEHSPGDILDAVVVRQVLEVGFLPSAIAVLSPESLETMRDTVHRMRARMEAGQPFPDEDREFHDALYRGLDNQLLTSLLDNFWRLFAGVDLDVLRHREGADETIRHHLNIIEAIERGDSAVAQFHMEMHFYDSVESMRDFVAQVQQGRVSLDVEKPAKDHPRS